MHHTTAALRVSLFTMSASPYTVFAMYSTSVSSGIQGATVASVVVSGVVSAVGIVVGRSTPVEGCGVFCASSVVLVMPFRCVSAFSVHLSPSSLLSIVRSLLAWQGLQGQAGCLLRVLSKLSAIPRPARGVGLS